MVRPRFGRTDLVLLAALLAVAFSPMIGSWVRFGGAPPYFLVFPVDKSGEAKPGLCPAYFAVCVLVGVVMAAFYFFPSWFGFRERGRRKRLRGRGRLPFWFWLGVAVNAVSWEIHWFGPIALAQYSFIPLWWGYIVAVDGVVYARTGRSLLATETDRFIAITLVSIPAWFLFEFLNYFAVEFWVYPNDRIFSPTFQTIWFLLSFSVVLPAIFEWFTLLHAWDSLWNRWTEGKALDIPRSWLGALAVAGVVALALFGRFPFELFFLLWAAPPIVLTAALAASGRWTPFQSIARGDWSYVAVVGLASLVNGIFYEVWNYGSQYFHPGVITNPNYWYYEIPYVDWKYLDQFVFSAMPPLGFLGYIPFGFLAWVCWLVLAGILGLDPKFDLTPVEASTGKAASGGGGRLTSP